MILQINFHYTSAQCTISNFVASPDPSSPYQLSVTWNCDHHGSEFQITYQLINRDQCYAGDGTNTGEFAVQTTGWSTWDDVERGGSVPYTYSTSLSGLFPYSTYRVTIQSRRNGVVGAIQNMTETTGEAGMYLFSKKA